MIETATRHQVTRIRRETRRRTLTVASSDFLSPHLLRLWFISPELTDFESAAPDDHIKLFVPSGADGVVARDYTPRLFDTAAGTLAIDFAVHEAGPATAWALSAQPGDTLEIGGPRGSAVLDDDFDWYMLVGDETALPSISRRLSELRPSALVIAALVVEEPADRIGLSDRAKLDVRWAVRDGSEANDADRLRSLIAGGPLPNGDGYVWIAAEAGVARALRSYIIDECGHPRAWTKAAGYWSRGASGNHTKIED